ncbi:MAG: YceD family protein [Candidatus Shikimatogenerans bostrichidophilus]|nr:MAG: YceD family protein [Candidatus Shikimatogenerans bostrichidophilus]
MNKNIYNISLLSNNEKIKFYINKKFFKLFIYNEEDFLNPKINIFFEKKNINNIFIFKFNFIGVITLICDITYNKFIFKINKKKKLNIIFGKNKNEENDNYLILPFNYRKINISQYIYESIMLMLPLKKIDPKIKKIIY